ncbi:tRNA uridine-5-carboxymethylaminomethyl(34) synthesis enzyme MnmG [Halanaerobacter jeridensis]|uniref:tRNA uridine 5-carboxymethylaminomethyl modification enzyme MnmG n=1 Tax=Halanaerobacter jeridensis TaxID=706427 RepID=A0A939BRX1_9FIRM|nr:tRNA uridine-5-carboxymethylaminomethyl(34) synthesis enzyme MnmG [Halanaerobacter jeridensis]MBM7557769.1 tRNA uridine 5-carboxymethylaminomethyl modification enzyme [Halanaerobacter jeridensis]
MKEYDVVVIGAGHAGCEAALASARMGCSTLLLTLNVDHVALMPCNPSIGGPAKGHIVREIDALGGQMGRNIDKSYVNIMMLNTSKGPAVHALRAQADKPTYQSEMIRTLEAEENLDLKQDVVTELLVENQEVTGVKTITGMSYQAPKVVLTTGTSLNGKVIIGDVKYTGGRQGEFAATHLADSLKDAGIELDKFQTATPPRIDQQTVDFSGMRIHPGSEEKLQFSFFQDRAEREQKPCWVTHTNERTKEVIESNIEDSPLSTGIVEGEGPRYCPSIDRKIMRFPEKTSHQVFVEPEGMDTNELYLNGLTTSMPEELQVKIIQSVPGLEEAEIMRPGYAVQYDAIPTYQLNSTMENKRVKGLYTAGQINATSGYEEAAAQGLMAGINAVLSLRDQDPLILKRSDAYIGVLIDDLVNENPKEPYRMLTSRAEYRLLLRQDNADLRLSEIGYDLGLLSDEEYQQVRKKDTAITDTMQYLDNNRITPTKEVRATLKDLNSGGLKKPVSLATILARPELDYQDLNLLVDDLPEVKPEIAEQIEIETKYRGYIEKQMRQVEKFKKMEKKKLPEDIDYSELETLRTEAREKLDKIRPVSLGQASRIPGVSPADISALMIYLETYKQDADDEEEE